MPAKHAMAMQAHIPGAQAQPHARLQADLGDHWAQRIVAWMQATRVAGTSTA